MKRHLAYLRYVLRHKWFVFWAGLSLGVSIWQLIIHDWDKFLPDEWLPYARTFYTPDGHHQYVESFDFAHAWMKHQHRNKHHWQWWMKVNGFTARNSEIIVWDKGNAQRLVSRNSGGQVWFEFRNIHDPIITPRPMPDRHRREMLADWMGAGKALGKPNTWEWYEANKANMHLHPETRAWIEAELAKQKEYYRIERMLGI